MINKVSNCVFHPGDQLIPEREAELMAGAGAENNYGWSVEHDADNLE